MKMIRALAILMIMAIIPSSSVYANSSLLLKTAQQYSGLNEHRNNRQLKKLLGVNPVTTRWCGMFVAAIVKRTGHKVPKDYGHAKAWVKFGKKVKSPAQGDVVIIKTLYGYHVGFFNYQKSGKVFLTGGNQSNQVKNSGYALKNVVAIRRP